MTVNLKSKLVKFIKDPLGLKEFDRAMAKCFHDMMARQNEIMKQFEEDMEKLK